jgi:hypothetical protein
MFPTSKQISEGQNMDIFGYQHVQYPIFRQRKLIKHKEKFFWKALIFDIMKRIKIKLLGTCFEE